MAVPYLSVVIPAYNEEKNLEASLRKVRAFLSGQDFPWEVIVVDDGSSDKTGVIAQDFAKANTGFSAIKNPHRGKGYTVRTGVLVAKGEFVLFADADMATPIEEVKRLLLWVTEKDFDLAIASREGFGARREGEPFYRHFMGRGFNYLVRFIALRGINDTQCGFKLFRGKVAQDLFSSLIIYGGEVAPVSGAYMGAFDVEILFLARLRGYKIKEVPVSWHYVKTARLSPIKDSWRMLRDIVKMRLSFLAGKYRS